MLLGFHSVDSEDRNLLIFQLIFNLIDSSIPDEFSDLTPQRSIMNFQTKDKNRTSHCIYTHFFIVLYIISSDILRVEQYFSEARKKDEL